MAAYRIASPDIVEFARQLIKAEQLRHSVLEAHFSASEWLVLLELFIATEEGRTMSITDMGVIEGLARSTALGIVADMTRKGLLVRQPDPGDGRRYYLSINEALHHRINGFLFSLMVYLGRTKPPEPET